MFARARLPEAAVFLEGLAEGLTATGAAKRARLSRAECFRWRGEDPAFAEAWRIAYAAGTDHLEDVAENRAINGAPKDVWYQGVKVGTTRSEPSDRLLELLLKARAPERFRERVDHTVTTAPLTPEQLQAAREAGMSAEVEAAAAVIASTPLLPAETGPAE